LHEVPGAGAPPIVMSGCSRGPSRLEVSSASESGAKPCSASCAPSSSSESALQVEPLSLLPPLVLLRGDCELAADTA
jgi:hypothetical protein